MTHDTSKDPRLLVAQRACAVLKKSIHQKSRVRAALSKEKLADLASKAESAVMTLTYLYQEPGELAASEPMRNLTGVSQAIGEAVEPVLSSGDSPVLLRANFRWCLRTLSGLPRRMKNPGKTLASGVDLVAVQLRSVVPAGPFWSTRVHDGAAEHAVVTNMSGVESGTVLAVAFLPPREVGDGVSEAMFLGSEQRSEEPGTQLTEEQVDAREAAGILHQFLR